MVTVLAETDVSKLSPPGPPVPEGDGNSPIQGDAKAKAFAEIGVAGVKIFSGYVNEEYLPELTGSKVLKVYRAMADDSIVNAVINAITLILRAVDWRFEPADDSAEAEKEAEFARSLLDDMAHTWEDTISEILSMLIYGWSYHEIVLKRRVGPDETDGAKRSNFTDGRIGIRKLPIRSQDSLQRWEMQQDGGVAGLWQQPPTGGVLLYIPIERALLFRTTSRKASPEGVSILRSAYRPWYIKRGIEDMEAIGIERELAGLPVVGIPSKYLKPDASAADKAFALDAQKMARDLKFNQQGGVVIPSDPYQNPDGSMSGEKQVTVTLLNTAGRRAIDTDPIVGRYNRDIARAALADFLTLGDEKGSYALSKNKSELFLRACETYLNQISAVVNRFLLPRIWAYNGIDYALLPKMKPGRVTPVDLTELGAYIQSLAAAGAPLFPNQELSEYLADIAGLPEPPEDVGLLAAPGQTPGAGQIDPNTGLPIQPKIDPHSGMLQHEVDRQAAEDDLAAAEFMSNNKGPASKRGLGAGPFEKYNERHDQLGRFDFKIGTQGLATELYNRTVDPTVTPDQVFEKIDPNAKAAAIALEADIANRVPSDASVADGGFMRPDGTYTPERQALHQSLIDKMFTDDVVAGATPADGEKPTMTMLGGRGGSGKSFLTDPARGGPVDPAKTMILNSDDFKGPLAEASGLDHRYAGLYHEESDHVLKMASARAKAQGLNVAFDATMKSEATAAARVQEYKNAGYNLAGHYVQTSPQEAAARSVSRFYKNGAANGRYVPPKIILSNTSNERNFDKLSPNFSSWSVWDNNGTRPVLIARSPSL